MTLADLEWCARLSYVKRSRPSGDANEKAMLTGWLDWQHRTVVIKCDNLADSEAYRAPLATSPSMSIAGVVSHLTLVERAWLQGSFLGDISMLDADAADGWDVAGRSLAELLREYQQQCLKSQHVFLDHELREMEAYAPPGLELVSLRWIMTHLIEETGRHLGHLDLLREMIDGSRGQ